MLNIHLQYDPVIPLQDLLKRKDSIWPHNTGTHIFFFIFICNGQKLEAMQIFIARWIDKQLWCIRTVEYYSPVKREWATDTWNNMDEFSE